MPCLLAAQGRSLSVGRLCDASDLIRLLRGGGSGGFKAGLKTMRVRFAARRAQSDRFGGPVWVSFASGFPAALGMV